MEALACYLQMVIIRIAGLLPSWGDEQKGHRGSGDSLLALAETATLAGWLCHTHVGGLHESVPRSLPWGCSGHTGVRRGVSGHLIRYSTEERRDLMGRK